MKKTDLVRNIKEEGWNKFGTFWRVTTSHLHSLFGIARSSIPYQSRISIRDEKEREIITNIHKEHPWYGHRRLAWTAGWCMSKTRRLMRKFGIIAKQKKWRSFIKKDDQNTEDMHGVTPPRGDTKIMNFLKSLCPIAPHIVWRSDFTHIIYKWIHLYLATILDDYTKEIIGYALSYRHTKEFILSAIQDAIEKTGGVIPEFFHSDQGSEYTSYLVLDFLCKQQITISMSHKWSPWQNGAQESYYGKLKLELGDTKEYETVEHLILAIHRQIIYYNTRRMHTTLQDTPKWFHEKWNEKQKALLVTEHKERPNIPL